MLLSRVRVAPQGLDPQHFHAVMKGDAYGNHQLLWKLFPDDEERPFLFRQEDERTLASNGNPRGIPLFYVLSTTEPVDVPGLLQCETRPFEPKLDIGSRLHFRLRANPVVARRREGESRSRVHDVLMDAKTQARSAKIDDPAAIRGAMDEAAVRWLANKERSDRAGYSLLHEPEVTGYRQHVHRRRGREIRFSSVDYEGALEVVEPRRFLGSLASGIGRSRAFGCGMWMIRRA
jgi:CRISPR system Cascade subunit CasE